MKQGGNVYVITAKGTDAAELLCTWSQPYDWEISVYYCFVNRRIVFVIVACLYLPMALFGQYAGRHSGSNTGSNQGKSTAPADDPDLADFKRAVAAEATDAQTAQFKDLIKYTQTALQKTHVLRESAPDDVIKQATAAQDAIDEAQSQVRDFLRTFSDAQASALKKPTKKLSQSDAALTREAKKFAAQLNRIPPDPQHVQEAAVHLEQALTALQSDQAALGKEMGIENH